MKKRNNPKIEAMKQRSLIVENERQNLHTPKFYLTEQEEEIKRPAGDPYEYKKDESGYYFKKRDEENWKKTNNSAVKAVFGDVSSSKQTTTSKKVTNVSSDKPKNIKGFQQWVINTKGDKSILGKGGDSGYGDDGIWGTKTAKAWNKYSSEYQNKKNDGEEKNVITGDYLIPVAWPEYEPKAPSDWSETITKIANKAGEIFASGSGDSLGKLGHGGIGIVEKNGNVTLFEFGRYSGSKQGMGLTKIANIGKVAKIDSKGKLLNANEVAKEMKQKSQGEGRKHKMIGYVVPVSDVTSALSFAKTKGQKSYDILDMDSTDDDYNCGTFGISVAKAGGVPLGDYCFPTPISALESFKSHSVGSISA